MKNMGGTGQVGPTGAGADAASTSIVGQWGARIFEWDGPTLASVCDQEREGGWDLHDEGMLCQATRPRVQHRTSHWSGRRLALLGPAASGEPLPSMMAALVSANKLKHEPTVLSSCHPIGRCD